MKKKHTQKKTLVNKQKKEQVGLWSWKISPSVFQGNGKNLCPLTLAPKYRHTHISARNKGWPLVHLPAESAPERTPWGPCALTSAYVSVATHIAKETPKNDLLAKLISGLSDLGFLLKRRKKIGQWEGIQ